MPPSTDEVVTIESIGDGGDGIARSAGGVIFVPATAPGERVRVRVGARRGTGREARLLDVIESSGVRAAPPCRHFGTCGGCALQHLNDPFVAGWKKDRIASALARRGLDPATVGETVAVPAADRRRLDLVARRAGGRTVLGFYERRSGRVVDVVDCPVARPSLVALFGPLRALLSGLPGMPAECGVHATETDTGIDVVIGIGEPPVAARERLATFAERHDLARLSVSAAGRAETIVQRRPPRVRFGTCAVFPPPAAFLQASPAAERFLVDRVAEILAGARRVADLFAGIGTFALALADRHVVSAWEADADAVAALVAAVRSRPSGPAVTVERRDLRRRPVEASELRGVEGVVLDPPRAGADAQCRAIARSKVPVVAYVSCNPSTFARDARVLVDAGYRLEDVLPVDQFRWAPHVELAAAFRRA
jgi:23S rRNA (uracil1939-C5)-methyltransferase